MVSLDRYYTSHSQSAADVCLEALQAAKKKGLTISGTSTIAGIFGNMERLLWM